MPADVDRYVKEMQEKDPSMPDDKAWAIAWSRYCKYKNPGSDHCKQDDYFTGQGKKASYVGIKTSTLPQSVKSALQLLKAPIPRVITAYPRTQYDLYSAGDDGSKGFAVVLDLTTESIKTYWGNWGGGEAGHKPSIVDTYPQPGRPMDDNTIVIKGQIGGKPFIALHCSETMVMALKNREMPMKTAHDDEAYARFSDASLLDDRYGSGRTQIWYAKAEFFRVLSMGSLFAAKKDMLPDPYDLDKTHVYIGNVNETNPSKVMRMMQGEMWSPDGQASGLPAIQKCRHTSMYVGDIMVIGGETLMVDSHGFCDLVTGIPRTASALRVAKKVMENIKGKLPPPKKFPAAEGLKDKGGGGVHHTRTKDVAKGQSRKEKHKKDPRDKEASCLMSPLSLQRDYGSIDYTGEGEE